MTERRWLRRLSSAWAVEAFAAFNLSFLALDVWLAHESNGFANRNEWAPVVFSGAAPLLLLPGLLGGLRASGARVLGLIVGIAAITMGVSGMIFHLESAFFERQTLRALVYSAPFVAPLAYVGIGLLLLLVRLERDTNADFGRWVVFLALGGFAGNFALSLLDHAQDGFFRGLEWIPVVAAAYGGGALVPVILGERGRRYLALCVVLMTLEIGVGMLGATLHAFADVHGVGNTLHDRLVYGAPVFAPMLFADLALLASIGVAHAMRPRS